MIDYYPAAVSICWNAAAALIGAQQRQLPGGKGARELPCGEVQTLAGRSSRFRFAGASGSSVLDHPPDIFFARKACLGDLF
jgi:hypothetical protein